MCDWTSWRRPPLTVRFWRTRMSSSRYSAASVCETDTVGLPTFRVNLEPAAWPADIAASLARAQAPPLPGPLSNVGLPPVLMFDAIDSQIPALFVAVPFVKKISNGQQLTLVTAAPGPARLVAVVLDRNQLQHRLLEPLVAKHFGDAAGSEYLVTIVRRDDASTPVFHPHRCSRAPSRP
jgi:hypothetical protein